MKEHTLDADEARDLARRIIRSGVPPLRLLKHAGEAVADRAFSRSSILVKGKCKMCRISACAGKKECWRERAYDFRPQVTVLAGTGENGGSGWMAAEVLADARCDTVVVAACRPQEMETQLLRTEARRIQQRAEDEPDLPLKVLVNPSTDELEARLAVSDSIVDALLGAGFDGLQVPEPLDQWIILANDARSRGAYVVASDVPSGLNGTTGKAASPRIIADVTVCMMVYKTGVRDAEPGIAGDVNCDWIGVWPLDFLQEGAEAS